MDKQLLTDLTSHDCTCRKCNTSYVGHGALCPACREAMYPQRPMTELPKVSLIKTLRTAGPPADVARALTQAVKVAAEGEPRVLLPMVRVIRKRGLFLRECPTCKHAGIVNFERDKAAHAQVEDEDAAFRRIATPDWQCGWCAAGQLNPAKFDEWFRAAFVVVPPLTPVPNKVPFGPDSVRKKFHIRYYTLSDAQNEIEVEATSREQAIEIARQHDDFDQLFSAR